MKLQLEKPIAFLDIEATGLNVSKDRIVEIAIVKVNPDGSESEFVSLVNPEMPIPQEVIAIHGITDEKVKDAPTFGELAPQLIAFIEDADLAGYNSNKFDIPMLAEELLRVGNTVDLSKKKFVDVQNIFHKMEQRTLAAAYQFYCKKEIHNAHSALADTKATWEVFQAQLEKYEELKTDVAFLSDFSKGGQLDLVDYAGRLAKNAEGEVVYNFGKHKGKSVEEVGKIEPGYYGWFVSDGTDFPKFTKQKLKEEMDRIKAKQRSDKNEITPNKLEELKNKFGGK
ncbi:MAG: polymerase subunit epsilon [Crocinitomicaceae bacterium]|jgi:DNA polymerase-3 subunit epsilon|nr:polymerase subunit epsilon [Crocinitomicaceae bacterium]